MEDNTCIPDQKVALFLLHHAYSRAARMSSSSGSEFVDAQAAILCDCEPPQPAKLRVCSKPDNPFRRFYNCRYSMYRNRPDCNFFDWLDDPLSGYYKGVIRQLRTNDNVEAVERAEKRLAIAEANLRAATQELGLLTAAKAKEKEKSAVTIAVLKKDVEALKTRGKIYWYIILVLVVVVMFLVLLK